MDSSLILEAYQKLNKCTPLRIDCGRLCNKVCCNDTDPDSGMLLFPGEAEIFKSAPGFQIQETRMTYGDGKKVLLVQCNGQCDRDKRPLACRVFPLTPYLTEKGIMTVIIDPRAKPVCPIAVTKTNLDPEFIRTVRKTCQPLLLQPEFYEYVVWLSHLLDEYQSVIKLFVK